MVVLFLGPDCADSVKLFAWSLEITPEDGAEHDLYVQADVALLRAGLGRRDDVC